MLTSFCKLRRLISSTCFTLVGGALLINPAFAQAEDVLSFQSFYNGKHAIHDVVLQPWFAELEQKSGGKLKIDFFLGGGVVKINAMLEAVRDNVLDMAVVTNIFYLQTLPRTQALGLPYLGGDALQNAKILWKMWNELPGMKEEVEQYGKVLAMWATDRYAFISTKGPITKPSDLAGKRVLIGSGNQVDEVKAWGGIPVQLLNTEVYTGLQRGMGEVFYAPLPTVRTLKLNEVARYISIIPSRVSPLFMYINHDVYNSLPKDVQEILVNTTGEDLTLKLGATLQAIGVADIDFLRENGCTVEALTAEQIAAFRVVSEPPMLASFQNIFKEAGMDDAAVKAFIAKAYELAAQAK